MKNKIYRVEKPEAENIGIDFSSLSDVGQGNRFNNNRRPMPRPKVNNQVNRQNNRVDLNKQNNMMQNNMIQNNNTARKNDVEASWDSSYIDGDDTIDF